VNDESTEPTATTSAEPSPRAQSARKRRLKLALWLTAGVVVLGFGVIGLIASIRVAHFGLAGKRALLQADDDVRAQQVQPAQQDLGVATQDFQRMQHELNAFGPVLAVARAIPLVRVQVRAVQVFAKAGLDVSRAGSQVVDAAQQVEHLKGADSSSTTSLDRLRTLQVAVAAGLKGIEAANTQLARLKGYRLFGPLGSARNELSTKLSSAQTTVQSADDGLTALLAFIGGSGPRQYLVLSENPDEIRPTGGFFGSYGLLSANGGQLHLDQYGDIQDWLTANPNDLVAPAQSGPPFNLSDPPIPETLANVNTSPDWPQVAQLALQLWRQGGQQGDGVVSFTPEFMARVLAVVGPVSVPSYNETVTAKNVIEKLNYYTHVLPPPPGTDRKAFLSPLGQAVMSKLISAPPSQWVGLATALGKAFGAGELLVWSRDSAVEAILARRGWDGAVPATRGDFFSVAEFDYESKNGGGITRSFDHDVTIGTDGSAHITTTITFTNHESAGPTNENPLLYVTLYGPAGATIDPSSPDLIASGEPTIAGHPAAGWFIGVPPNSTATLTVSWDAPEVALRLSNGSWEYQLHWRHVVDNTGDILHLHVTLPTHGRWIGPAPPAQSSLSQDLNGAWIYRS
jgi:Protein of unknown function (DUF4012)